MSDLMNYAEFRAQYEEQHPASVPKLKPAVNEYPNWLASAALIMFIAASILSAVHTIPTVYRGIEPFFVDDRLRAIAAIASPIFIELMILLAAYLSIKNRWTAYLCGTFAFFVACLVNVYSVGRAYNVDSSDVMGIVVAVAVGLAAPIAAFAVGKIYVSLHRSELSSEHRAKKAYEDECLAHDDSILKAFNVYLKQEAKRVKPEPVIHETHEIHEPKTVSQIFGKPRVKLHEIARQVHENRDDGLSTDEMMMKYSISSGGTSKVRSMLSSMNGHSANGNGGHE